MVAPEGDAGVVEDQVHLAVVGDDLVGPGVDGGPVGHVECCEVTFTPQSLAAAPPSRPGRSSSMSASARCAPRRARSSARARPMPEPRP